MKSYCLQMNKKKLALWLAFHLLLVMATLIRGNFAINTDLLDILPSTHSMQAVAEADKLVTERNSQNIVILASHQDFSVAKTALEKMYKTFQNHQAFEQISLYFDATIVSQISDYLFTHRYSLLDEKTRNLLNEGRAQDLAQQAMATIYSPFTLTGLKYLNQDPFMLTESRFQGFLESSLAGSTAMSPKEDILATLWEGKWYTMMQGSLTKEATAITERGGIIPTLKEFAQQLEDEQPGLDFIFSGVPFHSFESSSNAQKEISLITTISLLLVLVVLLLVFRTLLPVVVSMLTIGISALVAVVAVLLCFGEMHIMALVFGTTLIGLGVDYSIHFFMAQRSGSAKNGQEALQSIFKGITMGFLSTQICFVLLFLAPFPILKEIAVFLSFGLTSTYLSVFCLYPALPPIRGWGKERMGASSAKNLPLLSILVKKKSWTLFRPCITALLLIFPLLVLILRWQDIRVENSLSQLYTMSSELAHDEITSAQVLNHGSTGWYYIVTGDSQNDLLMEEEKLRQQLDLEITKGSLSSYLATSLFVPSISEQEASYKAAQNLIPLAPQHMEALGFGAEEIENLIAQLQSPPKTIDIEEDLPSYLSNSLKNLWLGQLNHQWYSVVMPLHTTEEGVFRSIAENNPNVFFANLTQDVSKELDSLTKIMLILIAIAILAILFVLKLWYSFAQILRIGSIPLLIFLVTTATLTLCNIPLGFFSVAALLLVFGTGIDYIIYTIEAEGKRSVSLAIGLSYGTTAMSFGALVLTSFTPVHIFGLTVLTGLSTGYIASILFSRHPRGS